MTKEHHVGAYHQAMAQWAVAEPAGNIELVDEAVDVTATEPHYRLISRLWTALSYAFAERAVVLADIFLRVDNKEQVSPDVLVAPGATQRAYTVYPVPKEPVPAVTIEVLSPVNHQSEGRGFAENKRRLLGRIGVPLHIEIDPDAGSIALWELRGNTLVNTNVCTTYTSKALGDITIEIPEPGTVNVRDHLGALVLDGGHQLAHYYREVAAHDREVAARDQEVARQRREVARQEARHHWEVARQATRYREEIAARDEEIASRDQEVARQAARAARLEARLRELGINPDE